VGFNGCAPRSLIRPGPATISLNLATRPLWAAIIGPSSRSSTVGIFARTRSRTRRGFRPWAVVKSLRGARSVFTEKTRSRSTPAVTGLRMSAAPLGAALNLLLHGGGNSSRKSRNSQVKISGFEIQSMEGLDFSQFSDKR
jgi:hypothetical protein